MNYYHIQQQTVTYLLFITGTVTNTTILHWDSTSMEMAIVWWWGGGGERFLLLPVTGYFCIDLHKCNYYMYLVYPVKKKSVPISVSIQKWNFTILKRLQKRNERTAHGNDVKKIFTVIRWHFCICTNGITHSCFIPAHFYFFYFNCHFHANGISL